MEIVNMSSYIEEQVNRTGRWIRKYIRRKEEEWPEKNRLGCEIMNLLVERETSLGDALDVLTRVMLGPLVAHYGNRDEFHLFYQQVRGFPVLAERDRAVGSIPKKYPGTDSRETTVLTRTVAMIQEPESIHRLVTEVGEIISKRRPSLPDGINGLTGTMLTAIEATCGRERADEFDLLLHAFSRYVRSSEFRAHSSGRVQ
jgi:hypothetical protein